MVELEVCPYLRILKSEISFQVLKKKRISSTEGLYHLLNVLLFKVQEK